MGRVVLSQHELEDEVLPAGNPFLQISKTKVRLTALIALLQSSDLMGTFRNPIISGFHPDPSICRVGGDYYLVTSSFEFFPGVPLFHSTNLVNWRQIGHVLTRESQLPLGTTRPSGGIFAPTIRHHRGRFYMVTTNVEPQKGHFYVYTDDILKPWSDPIWVEGPGIDPDLFFDEDGRAIFTCTRWKAVIDIETGKVLTELPRWKGTGGNAPEAPHIYRVGSYYYTLMAEGGTEYGHMITLARSSTLEGPFEPCPHNPILSHRSLPGPIQSTGHGDLVQAFDGRWWIVFLAVRPAGYPWTHHLGRETFLAPVTWENGWPIVNEGRPITLEMSAEGVPNQNPPALLFEDNFDTATHRHEWNFLRNPDPDNYRYGLSRGGISLRCTPTTLDETASPSWIGRRLAHFNAKVSVRLKFDPAENEEAGLTSYMRTNYHAEIALTRRGGKVCIVARQRLGELLLEKFSDLLPDSTEIELSIMTDSKWIDLGYFLANGERLSLHRAEARLLSTEVAGDFTGLYMALYAQSQTNSDNWADFHRFCYRGE
jgi:alpha-N-arabinofuranosidase